MFPQFRAGLSGIRQQIGLYADMLVLFHDGHSTQWAPGAVTRVIWMMPVSSPEPRHGRDSRSTSRSRAAGLSEGMAVTPARLGGDGGVEPARRVVVGLVRVIEAPQAGIGDAGFCTFVWGDDVKTGEEAFKLPPRARSVDLSEDRGILGQDGVVFPLGLALSARLA
jgi:hypothetical protein